jgi:hypothetical protein
MNAERPDPRQSTLRRDPALWVASLAIVAVTLVRTLAGHTRLAWWDLDASLVILPETAITPAWSLGLDALVWIAVAGVLFRLRARGASLALPAWGLIGAAAAAVAWHGVFKPTMPAEGVSAAAQTLGIDAALLDRPLRGSFDSLVRGSVWLSAMAGALALLLAGRVDPALRRVALAALLSVLCLLACKGAHQFLVEHAVTVAEFQANTEEHLAAQGLRPGSATAREYERRLRHPDATGWFGLSNVYGSAMAAGVLACFGVAVRVWWGRRLSERNGRELAGAVVVLGLTVAGLYCSQSKGAMVALCAAAGLIGWLRWSPRLAAGRLGERLPGLIPRPLRPWLMPGRRHAGLVVIGGIALSLGAIVARGAVGLASGERSLLFRWHYLVASGRIWREHPIAGVGPAEFQAAYALHKVPLNPEVVESPHSVFVDWVATLGSGGLAMAGVLIWMAWRVGVSSGRAGVEPSAEDEAFRRRDRIALLLTIAAAAGFTAWRQLATTAPDEALIKLAGTAAMLVSGVCLARWLAARPGRQPLARLAWLGVAGAAVALLVHGQIEMVLTTPGSAGWALGIVGLAAAGPAGRGTGLAGRGRLGHSGLSLMPLIGALVAGGWLGLHAVAAARWERGLGEAAGAAHQLAGLRRNVAQLSAATSQGEAGPLIDAIVAAVAPPEERGRSITMDQLNGWLDQRRQQLRLETGDRLVRAWALEPSVPGPLERAGQMWLVAGDTERARAVAEALLRRYPARSSAVSGAALLLGAVAEQTGSLEAAQRAAAAWARLGRLNPYDVRPAVELAQLAIHRPGSVADLPPGTGGAGDPAAAWAKRALANDELLVLDPLKRREPAERAWLEAVARGERPSAGPTQDSPGAVPVGE